jgi:hypothetical protein
MNLGWCCMYGIGTVYSFDVLELTPDVSFFFFCTSLERVSTSSPEGNLQHPLRFGVVSED